MDDDHTSLTSHADQCLSPWLYPENLSASEAARLGVGYIDWVTEMRLPQADPIPINDQTFPPMDSPCTVVPMIGAFEPVLVPEPEEPYYLPEESKDLERIPDEDVLMEEEDDDDGPVYLPRAVFEDTPVFDPDEAFWAEVVKDADDPVYAPGPSFVVNNGWLDEDFGADADDFATTGATSLDSMPNIAPCAGSI